MANDQIPSNSGKVSLSDLGEAIAELAALYRRAAEQAVGPNAAAMAGLLRRLASEAAAVTDGPVLDPPGVARRYELNTLAQVVQETARVAELARAAGVDRTADMLDRFEGELEAQVTGG